MSKQQIIADCIFQPIIDGSQDKLIGILAFHHEAPSEDVIYELLEQIDRFQNSTVVLNQLLTALRRQNYEVDKLPLEEDIFI